MGFLSYPGNAAAIYNVVFLKNDGLHMGGQLGKVKSLPYCLLPPILSMVLSSPNQKGDGGWVALKTLE